jgi:hypothetical protein
MDMVQLDAAGLTLGNLPGHDGSRCYALAVDQRRASVQLNERLEALAHELQVRSGCCCCCCCGWPGM